MTSSSSNRIGNINPLVDHLFRRKYGELTAGLTRIFGSANIDLVESVVQDAFLKACQTWPFSGIPENPGAWLATVARNRALDIIRRQKRLRSKENEVLAWQIELHSEADDPSPALIDDQLRLIFLCSDPALSKRSQLCMTLKIAAGFSVREIAHALLSTEGATRRLLSRAKATFREQRTVLEITPTAIAQRLDTVLDTLYLIFNEGYSAYEGERLIRGELCAEAIHIVELLLKSSLVPDADIPQIKALAALMLFHASRLPARMRGDKLVLLADQERSLWDRGQITRGARYLSEAQQGDRLTPYHLQALIAACHAAAPSYEQTDWHSILQHYDRLSEISQSPVILLNRAIAISMLKGPQAGLTALDEITGHPAMSQYYLLPATRAEFHLQLKHTEQARQYFEAALALPCNQTEKKFLRERLATCHT